MQTGLKVWSTNPLEHQTSAIMLAEKGICQYVEIYVVPDSLELIERWQILPVPKVIHAPHLAHNFNLADKNLRSSNRKIFADVQRFADQLQSNIIICHAGTGGSPEEAIHQLQTLNDPRIVLENKPFWQHPSLLPSTSDLHCRGAVFEEFSQIAATVNRRICHDIAHTVCMANSLQLDPCKEILRFETFRPLIYHLSDLTSADDELDSHTALDQGAVDWRSLLKLINPQAMLTLETPKMSQQHLNDFAHEVKLIRQAGF